MGGNPGEIQASVIEVCNKFLAEPVNVVVEVYFVEVGASQTVLKRVRT